MLTIGMEPLAVNSMGRYLTFRSLTDRLGEVCREALVLLLNEALDSEVTAALGRGHRSRRSSSGKAQLPWGCGRCGASLAREFARNGHYGRQLQTLHTWVLKQVNTIPSAERILVTSHDAFGYFFREYGFRSAAPAGWSTGEEVGGGITPARRKAALDSIREFGVKAIFVETTVNPKLIREIASEAGVRIGGELYSDSMGPAGSAGETYIGMMRENALTVLEALGG